MFHGSYYVPMSLETKLNHQFQDIQHKALHNILYSSGCITSRIADVLKPFDMSLQQVNVLSILKGQPKGNATVALIKSRMLDKRSNVSRMLNKLMQKKLVEKRRCTLDQRVVYIKLTSEGAKMRDVARKEISKEIYLIMKGLSEERMETLNGLLDSLHKAE